MSSGLFERVLDFDDQPVVTERQLEALERDEGDAVGVPASPGTEEFEPKEKSPSHKEMPI